MNEPPIALYAVGCKSWHDNLKETFRDNKGMTWLQYNVDISNYYNYPKYGFKDILKKYGYFYVYGHVTKTDYDFCNFEPKEIRDGKVDHIYCFKTNGHFGVEEDITPSFNEGTKVSVIYKIINETEPIIRSDKQNPPPEAPPFKAYDIIQGHCDKIIRECDRIKCEDRKLCEYKQNHCFYKYAYQTWLPVGDIIDIEPIKYDQFDILRIIGKDKVDTTDLRYRRIFPVINYNGVV